LAEATSNAILMGLIALPTMFAVIAIFIFATKALNAAFPADEEEEEEEEE